MPDTGLSLSWPQPRREEQKFDYDNPATPSLMAGFLQAQLLSFLAAGAEQVVAMCIGTDRSTGDALGPLVGTLLTENNPGISLVLGTLEKPVHASNLQEHIDGVYRHCRRPVIIAVDACLGRLDSVGSITVGRGPLRPGAGVNKALPQVGQVYITGVVNVGGFMEYFVLQNTRLSLVMKMARTISGGIALAMRGLAAHEVGEKAGC